MLSGGGVFPVIIKGERDLGNLGMKPREKACNLTIIKEIPEKRICQPEKSENQEG